MLILLTAIAIPAMIPFAMESRAKKFDAELKEAVRLVKLQNPELPNLEEKVHVELESVPPDRGRDQTYK